MTNFSIILPIKWKVKLWQVIADIVKKDRPELITLEWIDFEYDYPWEGIVRGWKNNMEEEAWCQGMVNGLLSNKIRIKNYN
jgi:hypothetical protein